MKDSFTGPEPPAERAFMGLTAEGGLISDTETSSEHSRPKATEPGQFCMIEGYTAKRRRAVRYMEGLVAVSCDTCKEQVSLTNCLFN